MQYLPHYINTEKIKSHFTYKGVGAMDALRNKLENMPLHVFYMKEEDYGMMLMSTYGTNEHAGE